MGVGFNGSGDYAKRTASLPSLTGNTDVITMSAWIKWRSVTPGQYSYPFGVEDADSNGSNWILIGHSDLNACELSGVGTLDPLSPAPVADTWYYVFVRAVNDASGFLIVTGGIADSDDASFQQLELNLLVEFAIGRISLGGDSWDEWANCVIAHARVWTANLSDAQLLTERDSATAVVTSNLYADWPLADNTDTGDDSGNGYDLTFGGTLTTETGPSLGGGAQSITPNHLTNTSVVHSPTVTAGAVTVTPNHLTNTSVVHSPTVTAGLTIVPNHLTNTSVVHSPTVTGGAVTVTPNHLTNTSVVHEPELLTAACIGGVLVVNATNGRYFENSAGPVVLGGFHTWYLPQDGGATDPPPETNYTEFLAKMQTHGVNFLKLWNLESARDWTGGFPGQYFEPNIYARTGPGNAADGKLKFDLDTFNQDYFDRLRAYAIRAGNQGAYCAIQLFQGWQANNKGSTGAPWTYHPFDGANNINSIDGDPSNNGNMDNTRDNSIAAIDTYQEAYIEKVIDTLNDLDHIIWEVENEGDGTTEQRAWQRGIADYIATYEAAKAKQHAIGLTKMYPDIDGLGDADLEYTANEWLSYSASAADSVADGDFISCYDTDHTVGIASDESWVFEALCNGHGGLWFMDKWDGALYQDGDFRNNATYELIRASIGRALAYAIQIDLENATPQPSLSATSYCLAKTTGTYQLLIYQPNTGAFNVTLTSLLGTFSLEWMRVSDGATQAGSDVTGGAVRTLTPPWSGSVVAFLELTALTVAPAHLTNTSTVHTPTIVPGPVAAVPDHLTNTSTVHVPTLVAGAVTIEPDHLTNTSTIHEPTVTAGGEIIPAHLANTSIIHEPTVTAGPVAIEPDYLTNTSVIHTPTIVPGPVTAVPDHLTNTSTVHAPTLPAGAVTIEPDHLTNTSTVHEPFIGTGTTQTIAPDHLTNTSQFWTLVLHSIPASRIYRVEAENRIYEVEAETRIYTIDD